MALGDKKGYVQLECKPQPDCVVNGPLIRYGIDKFVEDKDMSLARFSHECVDWKFSRQRNWLNNFLNRSPYVVKKDIDEFVRSSRKTASRDRIRKLMNVWKLHYPMKNDKVHYFLGLCEEVIREKAGLKRKTKNDIRAQGFGFGITLNHPPEVLRFMEQIGKSLSSMEALFGGMWATSRCTIEKVLKALVLSSIKIYNYPDAKMILLELLSLINQFDLVSSVTNLWENLAPVLANVIGRLRGINGCEAQGAEDDKFSEGLLTCLVNLFLGVFANKNISEMRLDDSRVRRLTGLWRTIDSFTKLFEYFVGTLEYVSDWLWSYVVGIPFSQQRLQRLGPQIENWSRRVIEIYCNEGKVLVNKNLNLAREVKHLYRIGNNLLEDLVKNRINPKMLSIFRLVLAQNKEMYDACNALITNDSVRNPPLVLHMSGGTGIGKSQLCEFLIIDMARSVGIEKTNDLSYIRTCENEFWDNYHSQFAVVYDDIFQSEEPTNRCREAMEIIRGGNNVQYPLHMATLSEKGNCVFDSRVIIMTSNESQTRGIGIAEPFAFWRRRDIVVSVEPKEQFAKVIDGRKMLDKTKIEAHYGKKLHWDVYLFYLCDKMTSQRISETPLDYYQFRDYCVQRLSDNYIDGAALQQCLSDKWEEGIKAQAQDNHVENSGLSLVEIVNGTSGTIKPIEDTYTQKMMDLYNIWYEKLLFSIRSHPWLLTLTGLLGFAGTLLSFKIWSNFVTAPQDEAEANISGDPHTRRHVNNVKVAKIERGVIMPEHNISGDPYTRRVIKSMRVAEGTSDVTAVTWMQTKLFRNVAKVSMWTPGKTDITMNGTFIRGRTFIVPKHFVARMTSESELFVEIHGHIWEFTFDEFAICAHPKLDLACVTILRKSVPCFSDITGNFVHDSDLNTQNIQNGILLDKMKDEMYWFKTVSQIEPVGPIDYTLGGTVPITNIDSWEYTADTLAGSCGAPLVVCNPKINNKIIGMHVAGTSGISKGYSVVVTQDVVKQWILPSMISVEVDENLTVDTKNEIISAHGCFDYLGKVGHGKKIHLPTKTQIIPSPLYEAITPIVTAPAVLSVKPNGPLIKGVTKYFGETKVLDRTFVDLVKTSLKSDFLKLNDNFKEVYEMSVVINGVESSRYLNPIDLDTSPGYPYVFEKNHQRGKRSFLRLNEEGRYEPTDLLEQRLNYREDNAKRGVAVSTIWIDNMKDERRTLQKVSEEKTRLFVSAPLDFTLIFRKYCLGFTAAVMEAHNDSDISVGINPHGLEWTLLAKRLLTIDVQAKFVAGDFSSFDGSLSYELIMIVCDLVNEWYADDFGIVRDVLFESVASAIHICGAHVYRVFHGNPSGNPFTAVMNSICNVFLIKYAYLVLGVPVYRDLSDFRQDVALAVYGDDNVLAVSSRAPWFNGVSISEVLKNVGMIYTNSDKTNDVVEFIDWSELSFLKRKFLLDEQVERYTAPLDPDSIFEQINWIREGVAPWDALYANFETVLIESFHHGESFFQDLKDKINVELVKHKKPLLQHTYYKYYNRWLDSSDPNFNWK